MTVVLSRRHSTIAEDVSSKVDRQKKKTNGGRSSNFSDLRPREHQSSKSQSRPASAAQEPKSPQHKATTSASSTEASIPAAAAATTPAKPATASELRLKTDTELISLGLSNQLRLYALESQLEDPERAVQIRREIVSRKARPKARSSSSSSSEEAAAAGVPILNLPSQNYDYARVQGACCENVIGYTPIPTGVAGPLTINGQSLYIPMATTEGALVASTNRGCSAINASGGVASLVVNDGMTRGPCVRFPNLERAGAAKAWLDSEAGFSVVEDAFNATTSFGRLRGVKSAVAGSELFIRFKARTGDAMGMNMMSKGVEMALAAMKETEFEDMKIVSLSGNFCTDKKAAAVNWVDGRGKSVAAQVTVKKEVLEKTMKIDVDSMIELNSSKNLVGSALAGSVGGFNAHAANIVAAIFLATGQDAAQVVESSSCLTTMQKVDGDLQISVSMPSIEVGTVGGGTVLEAQGTMLDLLGVRGADKDAPGSNAQQLARVVAAGVLAGELSLCSALAAGSLVKSHMHLNRK